MSGKALIRLSAEEIMDGLNDALLAELQAVADYDAHAQKVDELALRVPLETLRDVEQEHVIRLTQRIKDLGGTPDRRPPRPQWVDDRIESRLIIDLKGEQWAIVEYARMIAHIIDDDQTVELLSELLLDEMRHARWLKSALRAVQREGYRP